LANWIFRQAAKEQGEGAPRHGKGEGCIQEEGEVNEFLMMVSWRRMMLCVLIWLIASEHSSVALGDWRPVE
jgi:hypothetical protein